MSNQGRKKLFNMNEKCVNVSEICFYVYYFKHKLFNTIHKGFIIFMIWLYQTKQSYCLRSLFFLKSVVPIGNKPS